MRGICRRGMRPASTGPGTGKLTITCMVGKVIHHSACTAHRQGNRSGHSQIHWHTRVPGRRQAATGPKPAPADRPQGHPPHWNRPRPSRHRPLRQVSTGWVPSPLQTRSRSYFPGGVLEGSGWARATTTSLRISLFQVKVKCNYPASQRSAGPVRGEARTGRVILAEMTWHAGDLEVRGQSAGPTSPVCPAIGAASDTLLGRRLVHAGGPDVRAPVAGPRVLPERLPEEGSGVTWREIAEAGRTAGTRAARRTWEPGS